MRVIDTVDVGKAIRVMLAKENKSQTWLAKKVNVTRSYMCSLCNNKKTPSLHLLKIISLQFNSSLAELINEGE